MNPRTVAFSIQGIAEKDNSIPPLCVEYIAVRNDIISIDGKSELKIQLLQLRMEIGCYED